MHQEDLCQALGAGPTPAEMVDVIVDHSVAARRDLAGFLDALIYNWVVAAPGGHAKNHSLLLDEQSATLAPLCDLISYLPYRKGTKADQLTIAMRVGRDYTLRKHDRPSAWKAAAFYDTRPQTGAVVHLHSRHSVAWSMMPDVDPENALPPLTPYSIMQLGRVKLLPFFVPGDPAVGEAYVAWPVDAPQSCWPTTGPSSLVRTSNRPAMRSKNSSTPRNSRCSRWVIP